MPPASEAAAIDRNAARSGDASALIGEALVDRERSLTHGRRVGGWSRLGVEYPSYMVQRGAYPADRAAALSGVPVSTVHWWARHDVLVPSISAQRVKLWSYPDLMGLRII